MKKRVLFSMQLIVSVLLIFLIFRKADFTLVDIKKSIVFPVWIIIAVLARGSLFTIFASLRWQVFLRFINIQEKVVELYKIFAVSVFWGLILPSSTGFDAIRIYLIEKRHPSSKGKAGATVISERIFGFFLLAILGLIGSLIISNIPEITKLRVAIALVCLGLFLIIILSTNKRINKLLIPLIERMTYFKKGISFITNLYTTLTTMPLKKILPRALPFMLLFQISTIFLSYLIFKAFDVDIPFYYHLAVMPIIQIITIIPISISGFGIRESAFIFFYGLFGIEPTISFSASILYYLIASGTTAIIGGLLSLSSQIKKSELLVKTKHVDE